jgi:hypothetical protein
LADRESVLSRRGLLARRAGVHVDFHAHRHFDDLRGSPGHFKLPSLLTDFDDQWLDALLAPRLKLGRHPAERKYAQKRPRSETAKSML